MATISEQVNVWFDKFKASPAARRIYIQVPRSRVRNDPGASRIDGSNFLPEASYFSVRIVELFLRNGREYFRKFLPMAVTLCEFSKGGQDRVVPFFINNDKLREALGATGGGLGFVQMQDVYAMRYTPVNADWLSLFCGLFRVVHQDFAAALLDLLAEVGGHVGSDLTAKSADIAKTVYARLGRIVGMQDVEFRFGQLDGDVLGGGSGYRLFAGESDAAIVPEEFWMIEGRLQRQHADGSFGPVTEMDYCVVAVEHLGSRAELGLLATLPLHRQWRSVVPHLTSNRMGDAEVEFEKLQAEILLSPDLTESDRLVALSAYQKLWVDVNESLKKRSPEGASSSVGGIRGASEAFRSGLVDVLNARKPLANDSAGKVVDVIRARIKSSETNQIDLSSELAVSEEAKVLSKAISGIELRPHAAAELVSTLTAARFRSGLVPQTLIGGKLDRATR